VSNGEKTAESLYRSQKNYTGLIAENIKLKKRVAEFEQKADDKWEVT